MKIPRGFTELVKIAMKYRPPKPKSTGEIWEKFLRIVFMGGKRSEPEISFLINMLKQNNLLDLDYVRSTAGDDWRESLENVIKERSQRIKDEDILLMLKEFQKEIFRITASIKGSARFFKKSEITPEKIAELLSTKDKTWEFIDGLANNEDVSNIKYTKIIIWLHSIGYAYDFCPPSWQTKKFINEDIGPYYQFYEDDKYFMRKAEEFSEEVRKVVKKSTARDVAMAMFYCIALKSMLPARSAEKKNFTPEKVVRFLKKRKITPKRLSQKLGNFDERDELAEELVKFVHNA